MNKIIIDNKTELTDMETVILVRNVVQRGRISNKNKQYCYGTQIALQGKNYMIYTDLNKKSDRFIITEAENQQL